MDTTRIEELLTRWLTPRGAALARVDEHELLRALSDTSVRDAAIAISVGRPHDADRILANESGPHRWFLAGPVSTTAIVHAIPAVDRLDAAARRAGLTFTHPVATIGAYLDWADGRAGAAVLRLAQVPSTYTMARWLKQVIAVGTPAPQRAENLVAS